MSDTEAAWLAGFFDGEGSITRYQGGGYKSECWKLTVPNTNREVLEHIRLITGVGSVGRKRAAVGNCKEQWQWQVGSKLDMESVVRQMLPYLRIRVAQAGLLLAFVDRTR